MVMFHDVSTSAIPQEGQIPLIPPPTHPLLVVLSPRGLVAQDQVRILHGDEDGLVVLPQGIWLIWTYLDMYQNIYQNDLWISVDICAMSFLWISIIAIPCYTHFGDMPKYPKSCNLEAELPNSSTLVFILEGKLRNYPQLPQL